MPSPRRAVYAALLGLLFFLFPVPAQAGYRYTVQLGGSLTSVTGAFAPEAGVVVGATFRYTFTWDTDLPFYAPWSYERVNQWISYQKENAALVEFGAVTSMGKDGVPDSLRNFSHLNKGYQFASDNRDVINYSSYADLGPDTLVGVTAPPDPGYVVFSRVAFYTAPGSFTTAEQDPWNDFTLARWQQKTFQWEVYVPGGTGGALYAVFGTITSSQVEIYAVPGPPALLLAAFGLAGLLLGYGTCHAPPAQRQRAMAKRSLLSW